ncbi:MAG: hypothetical protein NW226_16735 [Microscillaceae bacterium]|nr:hypothetical protein [Microscillaceae bacterium]
MYTLHYTFLCILLLTTFSGGSAQTLSPEESQKLREELALMKKDPSVWKAYKERNALRSQELESKKKVLEQTQQKLDELLDKLDFQEILRDSLQKLHLVWLRKTRNIRYNLVFRVQVAGYKSHPIDRFHRISPMFMYDITPGGVKCYLLGHFYHYGEAYKFKDILRMMGSEAFVVGFKDGKRLKTLGSWIKN